MTAFLNQSQSDLKAFKAEVTRTVNRADVPNAVDVQKNIPIYDATKLDYTGDHTALLAEWAGVFRTGAGVLVIKNAFADHAPIHAATQIFNDIIAQEKEASKDRADHFAAGGANDRIWNTLEKLCLADPAVFAAYHGNASLDAASRAWLGPNYQMTAQVNLVRPGGKAQSPHRDYHLGFQVADIAAQYPAHVHDLSPVLTLQGAIAHCDMPIESGPTKLLPFSQTYRLGYLAFTLPEFRDYFEQHHVQLPLNTGDMLFFSPALYHAAGANVSADINRLVNLVQVGSAFGRSLEHINRDAMCRRLYPTLLENKAGLDDATIQRAITNCAHGYSFPTMLDTDPPVGGLAPKTQAQFMREHLAAGEPAAQFNATLDALNTRRGFVG